MEGAGKMTEFITGVGEVLTGVVGWFASVSKALIANEVFMIIVGVTIFLALASFLVNLTSRIKARQTRKA